MHPKTPTHPPAPLRALLLALALALAAPLPCAVAADQKASHYSHYYEDALVRYEKREYPAAIIQLKNALKADARNLSVQVLLGKALLANGDVAAAEVALNEALRLGVNRAEIVVPLAQAVTLQARQPEVLSDARFAAAGLPPGVQAQLLLLQASAQSDVGNQAEALAAIGKARAIDPGNVDSWLAEIEVQIRWHRFAEALAAADKAVALAPQSAQARYLRGSVAHAQGRAREALADYELALKLAPEHVEARVSHAGLMLDAGRTGDLQQDLAVARRAAPRDPRPVYLGALASERNGDTKAARLALAEVTAFLDPIPVAFMRYRPQLLVLGGLAHFGLGENEKARPYLDLMTRQQPDSPAAKLLAQVFFAEKNYDSSISTLEAYLKGHPNDVAAVVLLATAQMSKGRSTRAAQLLQEALKIDDSPRLRAFFGLTLVSGGKATDALVELENAWRRDPNQAAAGAAMVSLYLRAGQVDKALQTADALVRRAPKEAQFLNLLGMARAQGGDAARARSAYEAALKLDANFQPAQLNLARLELQTGQQAAGMKRLDAVLARDPKNVDALVELGLVAQRGGQDAVAVRHFEKAADHSDAQTLRPAQLLVAHHLKQGRNDAAVEALKRLNTKAPDTVSVLVANANVRIATNELPAAQQALTRAGRVADTDTRVLVQIAELQLTAQDAKGAQYTLAKALQLQPDFLPAKALLVDASIRVGDLAQAEQVARDVLARQPRQALGHGLAGDVAVARGQLPAAVDAYRRAHAAEPTAPNLMRLLRATATQDPAAAAQLGEQWLKGHANDVDVQRLLADNYARAGKLAPARAAYERVVALTPGDAEALNNLANVLLLNQDPAALRVAEQALALKPTAPYIIGTVGWAAHRAGQSDRALELLRDARLRDPGNADTRYFLGAVLASKGRPAEARDELQSALRSGQRFGNAKQAQELLTSLK